LGAVRARTCELRGSIQANTGSLGSVMLASMDDDAVITTSGDLRSLRVVGDIEGQVQAAGAIGSVMTIRGNLASSAVVTAAEEIGSIIGRRGTLSGALRSGTDIGKVQFNRVDSATISAFGDIGKVIARTSILDSNLLAGYDVGADGLPGTGDEAFNAGGAFFGLVQTNRRDGAFDGSYAMAGVMPYNFSQTSRVMLAPTASQQQVATFGAVDRVLLGQVFLNGDPAVGTYGIFAATEDPALVRYTPVSASGAPDFEINSQW
jgi:hypothetical protein